MSFSEKVHDLQKMVFSGQILEAFDKYYADDVVMQENRETPREGKAECRKYEEQFIANLAEFHDGGVDNILLDEGKQLAMIETWIDVTFKGGERTRMAQVSVQQWRDGQVVHERFYHS